MKTMKIKAKIVIKLEWNCFKLHNKESFKCKI